jgi:hypothetical protein
MQGKIALEEHFILPYIDPRHWPPLRRQQRAKSRPRQRSRLRNWLENETLHAGSALSGEFRIKAMSAGALALGPSPSRAEAAHKRRCHNG